VLTSSPLPKATAANLVGFGRLFTLAGDFSLGEATNRTDYESIDTQAHRLYIAKMGTGQLLVFDTNADKLVAQRGGFGKITGVLALPDVHRIFASVPGAGPAAALSVGLGMLGLSRGSGQIVALEPSNLTDIARLPGSVFPDGIAFDGADTRIFVSDEFGGAVIALDVKADKVLARIDLKGEAGNVQYDRVTARVLAREPYHFDSLSDLIPEDLALGWGPMSDNRVLNTIAISQGNRFYYWRPTAATALARDSIIAHSANTHVIPQNSTIAHQLERLRPGEVVTLSGELVDAARDDGRWIRTSLLRNDTGAGACEVMLVTEVET